MHSSATYEFSTICTLYMGIFLLSTHYSSNTAHDRRETPEYSVYTKTTDYVFLFFFFLSHEI